MKLLKTLLIPGDAVTQMNQFLAGPPVTGSGLLGNFIAEFDSGETIEIIVMPTTEIALVLFGHDGEELRRVEGLPGPLDRDFELTYRDNVYRVTVHRSARAVLNEDDIAEYLERGGTHCPYCGSDDVESAPLETDSGIAWAAVTCFSCEARWRDNYTLTGFEDSGDGPAQNVGPPGGA